MLLFSSFKSDANLLTLRELSLIACVRLLYSLRVELYWSMSSFLGLLRYYLDFYTVNHNQMEVDAAKRDWTHAQEWVSKETHAI